MLVTRAEPATENGDDRMAISMSRTMEADGADDAEEGLMAYVMIRARRIRACNAAAGAGSIVRLEFLSLINKARNRREM